MERRWSSQTEIDEWIKRRNDYRSSKQLAPLNELRQDDPHGYRNALERERKTLLSRLETLTTRTWSWPVDKPPVNEWPAPFNGTLYLPNTYYQRHGFSKIQFTEKQNLNIIVHSFYQERVGPEYPGINFVTQDGFCNTRNEYLGPSPRVAGYQFDGTKRTAIIEWYDDHLFHKWVEDRPWKIEVYYDRNVEGWVSKARGDFCKNYDWNEYLGLES